MLLRSKRIYTEYGVVDGFMETENGVIRRIGAGECAGARDIGALRVIPGIFDTHNHGTQGYSLWDDASVGISVGRVPCPPSTYIERQKKAKSKLPRAQTSLACVNAPC